MSKPIRARLRLARDQIERNFGLFGNIGFGFKGLRIRLRRTHRVTNWLSLKLLLYHAYKLQTSHETGKQWHPRILTRQITRVAQLTLQRATWR